MNIPEGLLYTNDHEWVSVEGEVATVGITDFAQGELGDIVFIEFPEPGATFKEGEAFGTIEAVKTVADLFLPLSGKITEINAVLEEVPQKVNDDPYGEGWIVRASISKPDELEQLLDAAAYQGITT
ncbi:MAG: glycine cleavage system protein GcvH [Candidatus Neomarinimicrobiota bacterium]